MAPKKHQHGQNSNEGAGNHQPPQGRGGRGAWRGRGSVRPSVGRGGQPVQDPAPGVRWMEHDVEDLWQALSETPPGPSPIPRGRGRGRGAERGGFFPMDGNRGRFLGRGVGRPISVPPPTPQHFAGRGGPTHFDGNRGFRHNRGRGRGAGAGAGAGTANHQPSIPDPRRFGPGGNPYLKPILFVKSTTVLFEEKDEIFMPEIVDNGALDPDDIPETQKLERIFHHAEEQGAESDSDSSGSETERERPGNNHVIPATAHKSEEIVTEAILSIQESVQEQETSVTSLESETAEPGLHPQEEYLVSEDVSITFPDDEDHFSNHTSTLTAGEPEETTDTYYESLTVAQTESHGPSGVLSSTYTDIREVESSSLFVLDGDGDSNNVIHEAGSYPTVNGETGHDDRDDYALGLAEDDIVLVPIKPSRSAAQPKTLPTIQFTASGSLSTSSSVAVSIEASQKLYKRQVDPRTPRKKLLKKEKRALRRRKELGHAGLGWQGGAPRIGDSDLEWGSDGPPTNGKAAEAPDDNDIHGSMDVDPELADVDMVQVIQGFVTALGSNQMTMQDVEIEEQIEAEDQAEEGRPSNGSSGEDLPYDAERSEEEEVSSSDEDEGGEITFKRKLTRMRQKGKQPARFAPASDEDMDDDDDDDDIDPVLQDELMWEDQDLDDIGAQIEDMFEQHAGIFAGQNRKQRRALFKVMNEGNFGDFGDLDFPTQPRKKNGGKPSPYVPSELREQWEKDRLKKAEHKRLREEARAAAVSLPGRKGKKARKIDFKEGHHNRPVNDIIRLEREIRALLADLGRNTLTLPPMDKESRRRVHLLAECFRLKSDSKGKAPNRYPVLIKTSRSGININEEKVVQILRAHEDSGVGSSADLFWKAFSKNGSGSGGRSKSGRLHREGEVVGQHAAHIDESNIGYQLLQSMGWKQGDPIGVVGGLAAPLTAVIKRSKLGLGAS